MQLLCAITDWEKGEVAKGRSKGNVVTSRKVVAADNWNWIVGTQRGGKDDGVIVGEAFYGNMAMLFASLSSDESLDMNLVEERITTALKNKTGTKKPLRLPKESRWAFGKRIDDEFDTSMLREHPPTVLKRIFKVAESD